MAELTDEQIRQEDEFLKGLPRFNVGAFVLPPIWGPAHGFWVTILYYPAWLFIDNLLYTTYMNPSALSITLSVLAVILYIAVTIAFTLVSQPLAAHRAEDNGISRETYLKRERVWSVICVIGGLIMIGLATWYNISFRPFV